LDPKAEKNIKIGYSRDSRNYKLYNLRTRKIVISQDVTFNEKVAFSMKKSSTADVSVNSIATYSPVKKRVKDTEKKEEEKEEEGTDDDQVFDDAGGSDEEDQGNSYGHARLRGRETIRPPDRYEAHVTEYNKPTTFAETMKSPEANE